MEPRQDIYFNNTDYQLNNQFLNTKPVYTQKQLSNYRQNIGIGNSNCIHGLQRYILENNSQAVSSTMQGAVYSAIDSITGRRVVIKCASKQLVYRHASNDGKFIAEDIRKEAQLLWNVSNHSHPDAGNIYIQYILLNIHSTYSVRVLKRFKF